VRKRSASAAPQFEVAIDAIHAPRQTRIVADIRRLQRIDEPVQNFSIDRDDGHGFSVGAAERVRLRRGDPRMLREGDPSCVIAANASAMNAIDASSMLISSRRPLPVRSR